MADVVIAHGKTVVHRSPDYILKVKSKTTGESHKAGAAWINEGGSTTIRLEPCTVLDSSPDILITLFKKESSK